MKILHLSGFFIFLSFFSQAQDVRDIVRFGQTQTSGSARFEGMAGSFGALGADLSSAAINPAGFGRYSSSTFGMGFQNTLITNKALFNGTETSTDRNSFKLNNLGLVLCGDVSENNRGFLFSQIGFTYNRIQDFNNSYSYEGEQFKSLLDAFCDAGNGMSINDMYYSLPFSTALAWDTYAIDPGADNSYIPRLGNTNMYHKRTIRTKGGTSEYNFNFSTNYLNKLYFGGNIGFRTTNYSEDTYHYERAISNPDFSLDSFNYEYHLKTKGTATNIKLGVLYLPTPSLRLGLSVHSSTTYKMGDTFSANMVSFHKDSASRINDLYIPKGTYNYKIKTPAKVIASLAYIFGTQGCINVDVEYVNHDRGKLKPQLLDSAQGSPYYFEAENEESRQQLRRVLNFRIGGEFVINSQYFIRAGFALYPSAYDKSINPAKGTQIISGGLGFKWKKSTIDVSLKVEHQNFNYFAFNDSKTEVNSFKNGLIFNYCFNF